MRGLPSPLVVLCAGIATRTPAFVLQLRRGDWSLDLFSFLSRASFALAVHVRSVTFSPLSFPCCLCLKKMCVHMEALQPRSQPV